VDCRPTYIIRGREIIINNDDSEIIVEAIMKHVGINFAIDFRE